MNVDQGDPFSRDEVGTSNGYNCFINFPQVPQGKLLVVRHVGALVRPNSNSTVVEIAELVTSTPDNPSVGVRNHFGMTRIGVVGASIPYDTWSMNQPLLAYVIAGQYARMTINLRQPGSVLFCQASISGLMVNDRSDGTENE
jgi:hypothetical protein